MRLTRVQGSTSIKNYEVKNKKQPEAEAAAAAAAAAAVAAAAAGYFLPPNFLARRNLQESTKNT